MSTIWVIVIATLALIVGITIGFFIARKYMENYLKKNPPINEQMLRTLMMQMGQKPSQKKINQMMRAMNSHMEKNKWYKSSVYHLIKRTCNTDKKITASMIFIQTVIFYFAFTATSPNLVLLGLTDEENSNHLWYD